MRLLSALAAIVVGCLCCIPRPGQAPQGRKQGPGVDKTAHGDCIKAQLLWSEDFETGDYSRWTGHSYFAERDNPCQDNGFSTLKAVSGTHSHRSAITCIDRKEGKTHRGYGGLQFNGDTVLAEYTNTGTGISAPYGLVNTFYHWLEPPTIFANGKWVGFFTANDDCSWGSAAAAAELQATTMSFTSSLASRAALANASRRTSASDLGP